MDPVRASNLNLTSPLDCRKKRAIAADKCKRSFKTVLANFKAAHTRMIDVLARAGEDANNVKTELQNSQVRLFKIANESPEKVREQTVKLAKAAEEVLHQLTKLSSRTRAQALVTAVNFLQLQLGKVAKERDDAIGFAHKKRLQVRMTES